MTDSLASGGLRPRFVPGPDGRLLFLTDVLGPDGGPVAGSLPDVLVGGGLDLAADRSVADPSGGTGLPLEFGARSWRLLDVEKGTS